MSNLTNVIFNNAEHALSSPFGYREPIVIGAGATGVNHTGADYKTFNKNLPQFAVGEGYVFEATKASDGALYVWVVYPELGKAFLHYHLHSISVRAGQPVSAGTLIGYTGKTGKATGIHLHLGIRDLTSLTVAKIKSMTWSLLRSCPYIDPEVYGATFRTNPYPIPVRAVNYRDAGDDVKWVQWELVRLGYNIGTGVHNEPKGIDGHFGPSCVRALKEFQATHLDKNGAQLAADGQAGPLTREALIRA